MHIYNYTIKFLEGKLLLLSLLLPPPSIISQITRFIQIQKIYIFIFSFSNFLNAMLCQRGPVFFKKLC